MKAVAAAEEEAAKYAMEEGNKAGAGVARKMLADQGKAIRAEAGPEGERLGGEAGEKAGGDAGKYEEFFRACNVLPFSCTHLTLSTKEVNAQKWLLQISLIHFYISYHDLFL